MSEQLDAPSAPLPLDDLDRRLAPLRRTVAFALADGDPQLAALRFFEINGAKWISGALSLDLPSPIRDLLAVVGGRLKGFDGTEVTERRLRLRAMNQALTRIDAMLGLPMSRSRKNRRGVPRLHPQKALSSQDPSGEKTLEPAQDGGRRTGSRRGGRGRTKVVEEQPVAERATSATSSSAPTESDAKPHHLGDPSATGRDLADVFEIAPDLLEALEVAGVVTVADLFLRPPTGAEVLRPIYGAGRSIPAERVALGGRIQTRATRCRPDGTCDTDMMLRGAGPVIARWRGGAPQWVLERMTPATRVVLVGEFVPAEDEGIDLLLDPEIGVDSGRHAVRLAEYGIEGIDDAQVRALLVQALPMLDSLVDPLPREVVQRAGGTALADALRVVHTQSSGRTAARRRLAFDEVLTAFLGLAHPRYDGTRGRGITHATPHGLSSKLVQLAEVALDDVRQVALETLKRDLRRSAPMVRLLTGEAGGSKALIAMHAAATVAESKSQVLWVAPDALHAGLRFLFLEPLLREVGLVVRLLGSDPTDAQRDAIRRGEVHVVFGTTDVLDKGLEFRRLGLVVGEEGQDYGRIATAVGEFKPPRPDVLVYTATPVPTHSLVGPYADHDVTVVDVVPPKATTERFDETQREEAYRRAVEFVRTGRQVWVVFPQVRGEEVFDQRELARLKATLENGVFEGYRICTFHGAQSAEERARVYDDFSHHRFDVLVSTTLVEEGPLIPNATVAVIEHADRFDLERAVRLRAQVAGGKTEGHFIMVTGGKADETSVQRLEALLENPVGALDGANLPEGETDPLSSLGWLDPRTDRDVLLAAHGVAHALLATDANLRKGGNLRVSQMARWHWERLFDEPAPLPDASPGSQNRRRRRRRRRK